MADVYKQQIDTECKKWATRLDELRGQLEQNCTGSNKAKCDVYVNPETGKTTPVSLGSVSSDCENAACMIDQQAGALARYNNYAQTGTWRGISNQSEEKQMTADDYKELLEQIQKFTPRQIEGISGERGSPGIKDFVEKAKKPNESQSTHHPQSTSFKSKPSSKMWIYILIAIIILTLIVLTFIFVTGVLISKAEKMSSGGCATCGLS